MSLIARWPAASMRGELLDQGHFDQHGLVGDRLFGVWTPDDDEEPARADRFPALLGWQARYPAFHSVGDRAGLPDVDITDPHGITRGWSDPGLAAELAQTLGREVSLRRRDQGFVYFPDSVHLTFQPSLAALVEAIGHPDLDVLRFRPNLHLDWDAPAFAEDDRTGWSLNFAGGAALRVRHPCERCVIPTRNSSDPKDRDKKMLPWLVRQRRMNFGVIADVITPGAIRAGEAFTAVPATQTPEPAETEDS
ncbi:MOSC domain-containing protein [Streptomyces canus]|uniref:MOSC domain-containing protein n=1 Tax=Streptomyces canus TaxID=58343 RepID=UPI0037138C26